MNAPRAEPARSAMFAYVIGGLYTPPRLIESWSREHTPAVDATLSLHDAQQGETGGPHTISSSSEHSATPLEPARWRVGLGWAAWHIGIVALLPLTLASFRVGGPIWTIPLADIPELLVLSIAYLATVLLVGTPAKQITMPLVLRIITAAVASFGIGLLVLELRTDIPASRSLFVIACTLTIALVNLSFVLRRRRQMLMLLPLLGAVGILAAAAIPRWNSASPPPPVVRNVQRLVPTALAPVTMTFTRLNKPGMPDGGGLAAWRDGFLLVTGSGAFYRLRLSPQDSVIADSLPMPAPMDRAAFLADFRGKVAPRLRVTDLMLDTTVTPTVAYVAHQYWNQNRKCFTLRVSRAAVVLPGQHLPDTSTAWKTLFESQPCLSPDPPFDEYESGGRLAHLPHRGILISLGDFGYSGAGAEAFSQIATSDYGKVFLLDSTGSKTLFTSGHRNPEGLLIDRSGRIWETEHGPQGGDELNLLVQNANYGWPFVTYGTEYGQLTWPLAHGARNHGRYKEPVHAFVPSIAISNLIEPGPLEFPAWQDDLLVGSLVAGSLYRIRLNGDRVVYVEPIAVGERIRDLAQGVDGRIVLWTDEGDLVVLAASKSLAPLTLTCMGCHSTSNDFGPAQAPRLAGIVGRPVASDSQFTYSWALKNLHGQWTVARLDSFLRDPAKYAPGNHMRMAGIADSAQRRAILDGLRGLH